VIRLQPAMVKVAAFGRLSMANHCHLLYCSIDC
jgi:hypothetical protein